MQHLEVSGAVRHIYIYVVRQLRLILYKRVPTILLKVSSLLNISVFMPCHLLFKDFKEAGVANY